MIGTGKKKLIYGLIGFGCGVALSGIMMLVVVLNTEEYQQGLVNYQIRDRAYSPETEANKMINKDIIIDSANTSTNMEDRNSNAVVEILEPVSTEQADSSQAEGLQEDMGQADEPQMITVIIPKHSSSERICQILEEQGVVADGEDFERYIRLNKRSKYLRSGPVVLPAHAEYDKLLEILATR